MRQLALSLTCSAFLLMATGCGGPATAPAPEASQVGAGAKAQVETFVENARRNPQAASGELSILMESLDAYARDQAGPFIELRDTAKELQPLLEKPASKPEIDAQLDKLLAKARALTV